MNDVMEPALPAEEKRPVSQIARPRDAASLIILRGQGRGLELLAGRRPMHLKFMPGVYVFPGGAIDPEDRRVWAVEAGTDRLPARLARCARAALRETWEEAGVLVGRRPSARAKPIAELAPGAAPIERAYAEMGLVAAFDLLAYVGRAITPTHSRRRFNTRFFLAEGEHVVGDIVARDAEFEDLGWHPIGERPLEPFREVTRFMLDRAIAMRAGTAAAGAPLFHSVGSKRRVRLCREGISAEGGA